MANPVQSWDVTHQAPATGPNKAGQYVTGTRVYIRTGMGHEGSVFVPDSDYAPEKVKPLLASLALRLDSVGSLSSKS